ncbi:MAG TPA: CoA ester lyase [Candidatus Faecousia faecigallinarum]|nr:CoA ester lyase [Candidatus Faecousia faecigallinarum]
MIRSLLFLPGNAPNMLIHGGDLGADAVIFDLEDAVSPEEKDAARILVRNTLASLPLSCQTVVRINGLDSGLWAGDLAEIVPRRPNALMLPKTAGAADIRQLEQAVAALEAEHHIPAGTVGIIPLLETAAGIENAYAIAAASPRVLGLFLGGEDLTADLRCPRTKGGKEIDYARQRVVCAARAAGVEAFDTPFTDVQDSQGLLDDAKYARALGFSGKAAISPRHVQGINQVFSPTSGEIAYAQAVLDAIAGAQGKGAISLHGKMIDAPIVNRARQTLAAAKALGLVGGKTDGN